MTEVLAKVNGHQAFTDLSPTGLTADQQAAIDNSDSPSAGNPFATGIYRTTVHIGNTALKALLSNPPILVAGVAGKVPVCLCPPVISLHVDQAPFESIATSAAVDIYDDGLGSLPIWQMPMDSTTFLGGGSQVWAAPFFAPSIGAAALGSGGGSMRLVADADLTAGDGDADVSIVYFMADV